jgi:hypothetical protein
MRLTAAFGLPVAPSAPSSKWPPGKPPADSADSPASIPSCLYCRRRDVQNLPYRVGHDLPLCMIIERVRTDEGTGLEESRPKVRVGRGARHGRGQCRPAVERDLKAGGKHARRPGEEVWKQVQGISLALRCPEPRRDGDRQAQPASGVPANTPLGRAVQITVCVAIGGSFLSTRDSLPSISGECVAVCLPDGLCTSVRPV